jgi:mannobiose 2-epimerase
MPEAQAKALAQRLRSECASELRRLLRWWESRMADPAGGFYGRMDHLGRLQPEAPRGAILNTRILWAFSAAARQLGEEALERMAGHAFRYVHAQFRDLQFEGLHWMLDAAGQPLESKKQIYAQAFGIYGFSEYYQLSGDPQALEAAVALFRLVERHSRDPREGGYLEAFDRQWRPLGDMRLSEKDANEAKTMNTHLHLLEAYACLFRAWPAPELAEALRALILLFLDRFLDPDTAHLRLFFDEHWQLKSHEISFGHDIEASWLLTEAAEALGEPELLRRTEAEALRMAEAVLREGIDADGALMNEAEPQGLSDTRKIWWVQAEALAGFINAWQLSGGVRWLEAAARAWDFIVTRLVSPEVGEWRWQVDRQGTPCGEEDFAGPWKGPYHNGRALLEALRRLDAS